MLEGEADPVVWMATLSCLIKQKLGFFWVGFYRLVDGHLRIGPYQGTLGCLRIGLDKGVCGAPRRSEQTVLVSDVHKFPGHIACDVNSESEIVVPVFDREERLCAVLDIDSDKLDDFSPVDQRYLEQAGRPDEGCRVDKRELTSRIRDGGLKLGFDAVGVTPAQPLAGDRFREWMEHGYHAEMTYMARGPDRRLDPGRVLPRRPLRDLRGSALSAS